MEQNLFIPKEYYNTTQELYSYSRKQTPWGYYSIKVFNKKTWKPNYDATIKHLSWRKLELYDQYFKEMSSYKVDFKLFLFSDYEKNYNNYQNLLSITASNDFDFSFDDSYFSELEESRVLDLLRNWKQFILSNLTDTDETNKKIKDYYQEIVRLSSLGNLDDFLFDSLLSDIYGTTTMEWQLETKQEIKELLSWNDSKKVLLTAEAKWIQKWFNYIKNNLASFDNLSIELIKDVHNISTSWLDTHVTKWLTYESWTFRTEVVDLWIFRGGQRVSQRAPYYPPKDPEPYLIEILKVIKDLPKNIYTIGLFHLCFYWLHPFQNGNKRTTRIIESALIQSIYDQGHYFLWMWYYFRKDIKNFFKMMKETLAWERGVVDFLYYYKTSFLKMCGLSLEHTKLFLNTNPENYIEKTRLKYYDEKDTTFIRFYKKRVNLTFKVEELSTYIKSENLFPVHSLSVYLAQRLKKHITDNLIKPNKELGKWYYDVLI